MLRVVSILTPSKTGRRNLGAGMALAAAMVAHALLAVLAAVFFTRAAPVTTLPRLHMTLVAPTPAEPSIEPVPQDRPPPRMLKPKPQSRPVTKRTVVPNPPLQSPPPEPESAVVSDPVPDKPVVVEPSHPPLHRWLNPRRRRSLHRSLKRTISIIQNPRTHRRRDGCDYKGRWLCA